MAAHSDGLHASQSGRFFEGLALGLTDLLDTASEKPGVDLMAGGSEGGLHADYHIHMSIAPERRVLSRKSRPRFDRIGLPDDHLLISHSTKAISTETQATPDPT